MFLDHPIHHDELTCYHGILCVKDSTQDIVVILLGGKGKRQAQAAGTGGVPGSGVHVCATLIERNHSSIVHLHALGALPYWRYPS